MKKLFFIFVLLLVGPWTLHAEWTRGTLKSTAGRVIQFEEFVSETHKKPVLIFLPGIYRGQLSSDKFTENLKQAGLSFVFMHFAEQPDSVVQTLPQKAPDFSNVTADTLAQEVSEVADQLHLEQAIPVTLSYSGIVTSHLDINRFPVVIEVSPIAQDTDDQPPEMVAMFKAWEAWVSMMPFGSQWLRENKRTQLHQYWSGWLKGYETRLPKLQDPNYMSRAIEGYTALSFAAESFDLRKQDFKKGPRRFFVLGEKEESFRSSIQKEAILNYQKQTQHKENVYIVPEAGHIVSSDQPEEFVKVLIEIIGSNI